MADINLFREQYFKRKEDLEAASGSLESYLRFILIEARVLFHDVIFRVKSLESTIFKISDKKYKEPWQDVTDLVGGRVFIYFREDASLVEDVLRKHFDIDEKNSINKADSLNHNQFGYTSRHVICLSSVRTQDIKIRTTLNTLKFEVQIRTVLEHGWAEVEHELVYKARTKTPDNIRRRFAASAASLELIETEFSRLRTFESDIIQERVGKVSSSNTEPLDRAWMVAALQQAYPNRMTWNSNPLLDNFYGGHEIKILSFLAANEIHTVGKWTSIITGRKFRDLIKKYAASKDITTDKINHLPMALLACSMLGSLPTSFEDLLDDEMRDLIGSNSKIKNKKTVA